jgi:hypothetical protein
VTLIEAMLRFHRRKDRSLFPVRLVNERGWDPWPLYVAAACSLSGGLDDARTDADLDDAFRHFETLLNIGVLEFEDWHRAACEAGVELVKLGLAVEALEDQCSPSCDG